MLRQDAGITLSAAKTYTFSIWVKASYTPGQEYVALWFGDPGQGLFQGPFCLATLAQYLTRATCTASIPVGPVRVALYPHNRTDTKVNYQAWGVALSEGDAAIYARTTDTVSQDGSSLFSNNPIRSPGLVLTNSGTPASSSTPCDPGTVAWDASYWHVCVATNSWKRT